MGRPRVPQAAPVTWSRCPLPYFSLISAKVKWVSFIPQVRLDLLNTQQVNWVSLKLGYQRLEVYIELCIYDDITGGAPREEEYPAERGWAGHPSPPPSPAFPSKVNIDRVLHLGFPILRKPKYHSGTFRASLPPLFSLLLMTLP